MALRAEEARRREARRRAEFLCDVNLAVAVCLGSNPEPLNKRLSALNQYAADSGPDPDEEAQAKLDAELEARGYFNEPLR